MGKRYMKNKIEVLNSWEKVAIIEAVGQMVERGKVHSECGNDLLAKLNASTEIVLRYD